MALKCTLADGISTDGDTKPFHVTPQEIPPGAALVEDAEKGTQETEGVKNY